MHAAERADQEARSRSDVAARRVERRVRACVCVHGRAGGGARGLGRRGGGERLARERGRRPGRGTALQRRRVRQRRRRAGTAGAQPNRGGVLG